MSAARGEPQLPNLLDRGLTCAQYLERWVDRRRTLATLLPEPGELPDEYRSTVAVTWSLSIEQANRIRPVGVAAPLLEVASFLDPNGIPAEVFTTPAVVDLMATLVEREVDAADLGDALGCLRRLSLMNVTPESPARAVRVHALVQRATREAVPADQVPVMARGVGDALLEVWPEVEAGTALGASLRANAAALAESAREHLWTPTAHHVLFRHGLSLGEAGLAAQARDHFQELDALVHDRLPADHPDTLITRNNLAYWRGEAGDAAGAAASCGDLLEDYLRVVGPDHPDTLTTRHTLASWRGEAGDAAGAAAAFEVLLRDHLRVVGPEHPGTLATRANIAHWRAEAGNAADAADAVASFEGLLTDHLRVLGPDHPDTLTVRGYLAGWRGVAGDPAGAAAAYAALLTDRLRVLGPDHPRTLATRNNLVHWRTQKSRGASP